MTNDVTFCMMVVSRTGIFDDQHDCQPFCRLKCFRFANQLAASTGVLSALAPLLMKENGLLLSEFRQASERQELAHKSTWTIMTCPAPEVADLDFEFPFCLWLGDRRVCGGLLLR